jgi:sugar phosphate isomerase/epimerase
MFHPELGISLHMLSTDLTNDLVQAITRSRIATLEVSARLFTDDQQRQGNLSLLQTMIRDSRICIPTIHALFGQTYDLSSLDTQIHQNAMAAVRAAIDLAIDLEASIVVVHASAEPISPSERPDRLAQTRIALIDIEKWSREAGKQIAIELLPRTCLGNTVEALFALLEEFDKAIVGVCLDTNHLMDRPQTLAQTVHDLGDRLLTLHLSDYDGVDEQHALPGQGVLDWTAFMQALRDIGYAGPFNYECRVAGATVQERIDTLEQNFAWISALNR